MDPVILLHNSRAINVATVILGTLAGLYGFNTILGQRGGILRQLIVALPSAALFGTVAYLENTTTNNLYSGILQEAFKFPLNIDATFVFVAQSVVFGFLSPFLVPNLYRNITGTSHQDDKQSPISTVLFALISTIIIGFYTLGEVFFLEARGSLPFGIQLSRMMAYIFAGLYVIVFFIYYVTSLTSAMNRQAEDASSTGTNYPVLAVTCVGSLVIGVIGFALLIPLVALTGWALIVYAGLTVVVGATVYILQRIADSLPQNRLLFVSLFFFVLAAALQIYQAATL